MNPFKPTKFSSLITFKCVKSLPSKGGKIELKTKIDYLKHVHISLKMNITIIQMLQ